MTTSQGLIFICSTAAVPAFLATREDADPSRGQRIPGGGGGQRHRRGGHQVGEGAASGREQGLETSDASVGNGGDVDTADCRWSTRWPEHPRQCRGYTRQDVKRPVRSEDERLWGLIVDSSHPFVYGVVPLHGPFGISEGDVFGIGTTHCLSPQGRIALAEDLDQIGVHQSREAIRVVHHEESDRGFRSFRPIQWRCFTTAPIQTATASRAINSQSDITTTVPSRRAALTAA